MLQQKCEKSGSAGVLPASFNKQHAGGTPALPAKNAPTHWLIWDHTIETGNLVKRGGIDYFGTAIEIINSRHDAARVMIEP